MMKRLSPKFVNRLIVGLIMLIPVAVYVGGWIAYLAGAHGSATIGGHAFDAFMADSWVYQWGYDVLNNVDYGFTPINALFRYVDTNLLHFATQDQAPLYAIVGYCWYAFHVILFDLMFTISTFFVRLIKNILDKLEGSAQC